MSEQQGTSVSQHLVNSNSALNKKVDKLAEALESLTLGDELKNYIGQQLSGIKQEGGRPDYKIRDLETYDGEKQKLRSWLTAANLQINNKGIEGEERKVRFIGGYLRGKAWNWFEPILRESDEQPRKEWSDRTLRILGSYKEMKKAMGQVFGEIDERKTAARKLQSLYQTRSVTDYITDFQMITSNLDWDEEALEDKYLEGLKPEVRRALIFFPKEHENLEELFERTQKIDREIWDRDLFKNSRRRHYGDPLVKFAKKRYDPATDRDGDIIMKGAKVNMEKARKEGLCFQCERPGHQARNCRNRTRNSRGPRRTPQDGERKVTVRMVRTGLTNTKGETTDEEAQEGTSDELPTGITGIFDDLSLKDLESEESSNDASDISTNGKVHAWLRYQENEQSTGVPGEQPDGKSRNRGIQVRTSVPRSQEGDPLAQKKSTRRRTDGEEPKETIEQRLAKVDFSFPTRRPCWQEFCGRRDTSESESKIEEITTCTCYGFNQRCWAESEERWLVHIRHCRKCEEWADRYCKIPGHSPKSKNSTLADLSNRRYIADNEITGDNGKTCCNMNLCTHEFFEHKKRNIPWWTCLEEDCYEHEEMKIRGGMWPRVPRISIIKAQECPCFRKGCLCNFSSKHIFRKELLTAPRKENDISDLRERIKNLTVEQERLWTNTISLGTRIDKIRMGRNSGSTTKQFTIKINIGGKETEAVVDCGADVNYVNAKWCEQMKFTTEEKGEGWVQSFDGRKRKTPITDVTVNFVLQGSTQTHKFRKLTKTGDDKIVLGMPWLEEENPEIDWKTRKLTLEEASRKLGSRGTAALGDENPESKHRRPVGIEKEDPSQEPKRKNRGAYDIGPVNQRFTEEIEEIKKQLHPEIREYASVFSSSL
jgi:Retrotransposon gag protein/gag-polyprotein putative aspartyl protease